MALAADFLALARSLAINSPVRGRQARLKRAISTAYYAFFHLLLDDAMQIVAPSNPAGLQNDIRRTFTHADMISVCRDIQKGILPKWMSRPPPGDLLKIAERFEALQEARHLADYDMLKIFTETEALGFVETAEEAFKLWRGNRASGDANVFLFAMFLGKRSNKAK